MAGAHRRADSRSDFWRCRAKWSSRRCRIISVISRSKAPDGKLTGGFVTVSNIESRDPSKVREGNERVVPPALERRGILLGAGPEGTARSACRRPRRRDVSDKARQLCRQDPAREVAGASRSARGSWPDLVGHAAELAKADLMTAMVGEFPELQGDHGPLLRGGRRIAGGIVAGNRGALSSAICRRCAAVDQDGPGARARGQDRYAGGHFRHRTAADRRQGSFRLAPRCPRGIAHFARVPAGPRLYELLGRIRRGTAGAQSRRGRRGLRFHRRAAARLIAGACRRHHGRDARRGIRESPALAPRCE